ncbi:ABC transporter substrate-binding protein, partial [Piscinibacter sp.]|uniref:ABC transporter substrate-binding protein n=1 Tax=Piscinibacter sp. TaxID=1903157 RepID=UPI002F3E233E
EKLSIALSTTPHAALLHIAAAQGYFADEGLEVTIAPVSHGKAAMELLAQGKADLASAAEVPFVISVMKGADFAIAATVVSVSTEMAVVARRDRSIAAPRDLAGKRVGVTLGTSGEYFLWAFLIRHKLAPDSVTLADVAPGPMAQELARGTIDAASTWQPVRSRAESGLGDNAVSFTEANAYTVTHVVVGRSDFLKGHPKAIEKLVRAMLKAEQFNRSQPEQALNLVADRLKIDARTLQPGWKDLDFKVDLRQSQLITLEDEARWAMARGYADPGPVPNFLPHLYLDALLAVRPERVTVLH